MENQEYTPYGAEWKKEMKKHTKDSLVSMLAESYKTNVELERSIKE